MRDDFLRAAGVQADPSAVAGVFLAAICAVMAGAAYLLWVVLT